MTDLTKTPSLNLDYHRTPHSFFTPTHLNLSHTSNPNQKVEWQSRKARKGRYGVKPHHIHDPSSGSTNIENTGGEKHSTVYLRVQSVESEFKPHLEADVSFWIAVVFTLGSAVWVVNGFLVFLPILKPELGTTAIAQTAAATAFIGGSIFEVGSYLMVVEALDRGRESNFGTALGKLLHHRRRVSSTSNETTSLRKGKTEGGLSRGDRVIDTDEERPSTASSSTQIGEDNQKGIAEVGSKGFVWWGKPLWHDLGYLAAFVQLIAATIFWISTITGLPGVIPGFSDGEGSIAIVDVFFWTPQVLGGIGFMISSSILMIEVQKKWYLPNLTDIGWHIGLWNLIGAVGFMLCGAFGYSPVSGLVYQSGCSTFWGSPAFLIGSLMQLYEVVWREPVPKNPGSKSG